MKTHYRDLRLANNAGITLPVCKASEKLLDIDCNWPITLVKAEVTCKRCVKAWAAHYGWAGPIGDAS